MRAASRRAFIRGGSVLGIGVAATGLAGCGSSDQGTRDTSQADKVVAADLGSQPPLFNGISAKSREIYSFEYRERLINGHRIHYVNEGQGPIVCWLGIAPHATRRPSSIQELWEVCLATRRR